MEANATTRAMKAVRVCLDGIKETYAPLDYGIFADDIVAAVFASLQDGDEVGSGLIIHPSAGSTSLVIGD